MFVCMSVNHIPNFIKIGVHSKKIISGRNATNFLLLRLYTSGRCRDFSGGGGPPLRLVFKQVRVLLLIWFSKGVFHYQNALFLPYFDNIFGERGWGVPTQGTPPPTLDPLLYTNYREVCQTKMQVRQFSTVDISVLKLRMFSNQVSWRIY